MTTYELQFDVVEPMLIFETFSNFGLKINNFYSLKNTDCITFEGTYDQLKKWSMENYDFSELVDNCLSKKDNSSEINAQIDQLDKALQASQIPVAVIIQSDNLTQISVYKVANLGTLQQTSISLKPGLYIAAGQRAGYRDSRVEFEVSEQSPTGPIVVICSEKI